MFRSYWTVHSKLNDYSTLDNGANLEGPMYLVQESTTHALTMITTKSRQVGYSIRSCSRGCFIVDLLIAKNLLWEYKYNKSEYMKGKPYNTHNPKQHNAPYLFPH